MNPIAPASARITRQSFAGASSSLTFQSSEAAIELPVAPSIVPRQDSTSVAVDSGPSGKLREAGRMHQLLHSLMKLNSDIEDQGLLEQIA